MNKEIHEVLFASAAVYTQWLPDQTRPAVNLKHSDSFYFWPHRIKPFLICKLGISITSGASDGWNRTLNPCQGLPGALPLKPHTDTSVQPHARHDITPSSINSGSVTAVTHSARQSSGRHQLSDNSRMCEQFNVVTIIDWSGINVVARYQHDESNIINHCHHNQHALK